MDFYDLLVESSEGMSYNPYSAYNDEKGWMAGGVSIDFLNKHFGKYETAEEMKNSTESEGLKLYFDWLKEKGILN